MGTRRSKVFSFLIPAFTATALLLPLPASTSSFAEADDPAYTTVWERFSAFDAESEVRVNHQPLDTFLRQTVLTVGRSKSKMGTQARTTTYTGSRVRSSSSAAPSKYEGNRVMLHAFTDDHREFLKGYKEGLESLSSRRPLRELNKNEQLAFWLNLYNVTVLDKVAGEYPIKKLKNFRQSKKQTPFWNQKSVTVEGVPLSLVDIEQILFHNWSDPRVMYGLFQGSIGGPSLPNIAFTAENVWTLLNNSALEFVNSNRGVRTKGDGRAEISKMYDWASAAFGNSDTAIISHIIRYADAFHPDLSGLSSIRPKYFDWNIADLVGGTLHKGQHTQLGGVLVAGSGRDRRDVDHSMGGTSVDVGNLTDFFLSKTPTGPLTILPPQAQEFMAEIRIRNDLPNRTPVVTVIDCEIENCEEVQDATPPLLEQSPDQP